MPEKEPSLRSRENSEIESGSVTEEFAVEEVRDKEKSGQKPVKIDVAERRQSREALEGVITFEKLTDFDGKDVSFRDPNTAPNQVDDPYRKTGKLEKFEDGYKITIDRGRYHPFFTGDRQSVFYINSQDDIDRLQVGTNS